MSRQREEILLADREGALTIHQKGYRFGPYVTMHREDSCWCISWRGLLLVKVHEGIEISSQVAEDLANESFVEELATVSIVEIRNGTEEGGKNLEVIKAAFNDLMWRHEMEKTWKGWVKK